MHRDGDVEEVGSVRYSGGGMRLQQLGHVPLAAFPLCHSAKDLVLLREPHHLLASGGHHFGTQLEHRHAVHPCRFKKIASHRNIATGLLERPDGLLLGATCKVLQLLQHVQQFGVASHASTFGWRGHGGSSWLRSRSADRAGSVRRGMMNGGTRGRSGCNTGSSIACRRSHCRGAGGGGCRAACRPRRRGMCGHWRHSWLVQWCPRSRRGSCRRRGSFGLQ
mmetsp:Transcript_29242/g.95421  ORF Transcript_29242/g.95421 Transcript_29242/m.95421 type:complete len:221 (+) Transcript_29242:103-765(+)